MYCWNGYIENDLVRSILQYVDTHADRLRQKYLSWIHDLGIFKIKGVSIIELLALECGLSYWWMTLYVEKSLWKSPSIVDALRLFALEEIFIKHKPTELLLVSDNQNLHQSIKVLCQNFEIKYKWKKPKDQLSAQLTLKAIYKMLPYTLQGFFTLARYLINRCNFRKTTEWNWIKSEKAIFFCSYFSNLDLKKAKNNVFNSHFWDKLHSLMQTLGLSENWLQIFIPHPAVPTSKIARNFIHRFNQNKKERFFHALLDSFLSWKLVLVVIRNFLRLIWKSIYIRNFKVAFQPSGSQVFLWPIMKGDWYSSMRGSVAASNLLWLQLFDVACSKIPSQKNGFYLCENQAWERAFVYYWKKHGHGQLTGVVHATVRFWDLRYYSDLRTIQQLTPYKIPQADKIALNGKDAVEAFCSVGFPQEAIVRCEALRYSYLTTFKRERVNNRDGKTKVLILGDYSYQQTVKMLHLLEAASKKIPCFLSYTIKPHPNYSLNVSDFPDLNLALVTDSLGKILNNFDIAYSSNNTTAAVDAYVCGLPVIVMLDETLLNFSPLRGQPNVHFIATADDLTTLLQQPLQGNMKNLEENTFFFLDPELPRWKKLLLDGAAL